MNIKFVLSLIIWTAVQACSKNDTLTAEDLEYRQNMRDFVINLSEYSKAINPGFIIIPQNGIELITNNGEENGSLNLAYIDAIDGIGQEDLFYGYTSDNQPTPNEDNSYLKSFLNSAKNIGTKILVTDYCSSQSNIEASYSKNNLAGYTSFAATHRELDNLPTIPNRPYNENNNSINDLTQVQNFLYLINPSAFQSKQAMINAISNTNYDLIIIDLFFNSSVNPFTQQEIAQLKIKKDGGTRLVISYLSIGEAEDYRYYWNSTWQSNKPDWIQAENPNWQGNYKIKYWLPEWQSIIFGNDQSYVKRILNAGFDGAYLDIIDAFEYFEQ
jgi:cysteinyl-tRNA synthetase